MATSGAFSTSNTYIKYRISIDENSQSASGNSSNVTVRVSFYRTNTGYETYGSGTVYCTIDGIKYTAGVTSNQKITSDPIVLFEKTVNVTHDGDGSKELTVSAYISHARFTSDAHTYTQTLTRIGRQSRLILPWDAVLGQPYTLDVERYSDTYTHTIQYQCGWSATRICEKSSNTAIPFTPPLDLAKNNTTGTSLVLTFSIETFDGDESVGSYTTSMTCGIPEDMVPLCNITVSDVHDYYPSYGAYIMGKSAFNIVVDPILAYDSEIVSYNITANGATYTTPTVQTDLIKTAGTLTITATLTDQRGMKGTVSVDVEVLEHTAPSIIKFKVVRCNEYGQASSSGNRAKIIFTNTVTALNDKNTAEYTLMYKKSSDASYTSVVMPGFANSYSNTNAEFLITEPFDTSKTYDVILSIQDAFSTTSKLTTCTSAYKLWSILRKGLGIAFGAVATLEGVFEVGFKTRLTGGIMHPIPNAGSDVNDLMIPNTYRLPASNAYINVPVENVEAVLYVDGDDTLIRQRFVSLDGEHEYERTFTITTWSAWVNSRTKVLLAAYPVGSIYISANAANPSTLFGGTWEQIKDKFLLSAGDTYEAGNTGGSASKDVDINHTHIAPIGYNSKSMGAVAINGTETAWEVGQYRTVDFTYTGSSASNITMLKTTKDGGTVNVDTIPPYLAVYVWKRTK